MNHNPIGAALDAATPASGVNTSAARSEILAMIQSARAKRDAIAAKAHGRDAVHGVRDSSKPVAERKSPARAPRGARTLSPDEIARRRANVARQIEAVPDGTMAFLVGRDLTGTPDSLSTIRTDFANWVVGGTSAPGKWADEWILYLASRREREGLAARVASVPPSLGDGRVVALPVPDPEPMADVPENLPQTDHALVIRSYKAELRCDGAWTSNSMRFADHREAERHGAEIMSRWFVPDAHRSAPSEDPVNAVFPVGATRAELLPKTPPEPVPTERSSAATPDPTPVTEASPAGEAGNAIKPLGLPQGLPWYVRRRLAAEAATAAAREASAVAA